VNGPVLGIDGSLAEFSAAVVDEGGAVLGQAACDASQALEAGLGAISSALGGRRVADLGAVAVCVGPGSYTGSRIAVSYAKSLAQAGHLPLVTISSYDVLEPDDAPNPFVTIVPARTGLICARLRNENGAQSLCGTYDEIAAWLRGIGVTQSAGALLREDDRDGLAKRGCHVRSISIDGPAAVRVARLALRRSPDEQPLAVVADYGFPPVAAAR
jgi:tRNA threonylcarbamoyl adenosine modification protein YeaZ